MAIYRTSYIVGSGSGTQGWDVLFEAATQDKAQELAMGIIHAKHPGAQVRVVETVHVPTPYFTGPRLRVV